MEAIRWNMLQLEVVTAEEIKNPFWDVRVEAVFVRGGESQTAEGFYDGRNAAGAHVWRVRWTPPDEGAWSCSIRSKPELPGLAADFDIRVGPPDEGSKGFLRAVPGRGWGLYHDNGEPLFVVGDTLYNLFGAHYCGVDVESVLRHRKAQGVNYFRARAQVSSYHPSTVNDWQSKLAWPWGGSPQWPDFARLHTDYFRAVDEVMEMAQKLGMGVEMVMEAWLLEFPFNDRHQFLPEFEELWVRYLVARYSAYPSLYIWCPANEYEFYPGTAAYHPEADRWFRRLARLIKSCDPVKHPIGAHNWVQNIPLSERLGDCEDVDVYLVQTDWFKEIAQFDRDPSLCLWLETQLRYHAPNRDKPVICDEFGYEKCEDGVTLPVHNRMDRHHTRRGQWKAGFSGCHIVHGFNNTWGPHMKIEPDAEGTAYLLPYYRWMTEELPLEQMAPAPEALASFAGSEAEGTAPLCLASGDRSVIAVYFPTAGRCELNMAEPGSYRQYWLNPRTGESGGETACTGDSFVTPEQPAPADPLDDDWVLCLKLSGK